jgi:predicted O-methyltransferase YrrM
MYNWTNNIPFGSKDIFINIISYFNTNYNKIKFGKKIFILELGSYTGMSLIQLVKLIPNSYGTGIDMWSNYNENSLLNVIDNYNVKQSFYKNIKNAGLQDKIHGIQIDTTSALIQFIKDNKKFDFIYVDGSHLLLDCYSDLILSWEILENGGILAIDDYTYNSDNSDKILNSPFQAVNHFLKIFNGKYKLLNISYRVFLEKI